MEKTIIRRGMSNEVLKLLTKDFETTNAIYVKSKGKPYTHYMSYLKNLENLHTLGLVEKKIVSTAKRNIIYWRKK